MKLLFVFRLMIGILIGLGAVFGGGIVTAQEVADWPTGSAPIRLTAGQFSFGKKSAPSFDASWTPMALPDNWNISHPGRGGIGWYRLKVRVTPPIEAIQAIYLPRFSMNAAVFLNGALLDSSGDPLDLGHRSWNRPLFVRFTPDHLKQGENVIDIRVAAGADDLGGLGSVWIGPAISLNDNYRIRWFWQILLPELTSAIILFCITLTAFLWWRLRYSMDGWFTLLGLSMLLRMVEYYATWLPFESTTIQLLVALLVQWFVVFMACLGCRLLQLDYPRIERSLMVWAGLSMSALLFSDTSHAAMLARLIHLIALFIGLAAMSTLIPNMRRAPLAESGPLALAAGISFLLGMHDVLQRYGWVSSDHARLSHLGAPLLVLTLAVILCRRYYLAIQATVTVNNELEMRLEEKKVELESAFAGRIQVERKFGALEERDRLMLEMHDGLGAHLTLAQSAMSGSSPDVKRARWHLQDCMLDLRLMLDAVTPEEISLGEVLGNLRYRLEPVMRSSGINLHWDVGAIATSIPMHPYTVLNVLRIFQEAFTNIVKHSNATDVQFIAANIKVGAGETALIRVIDNGTRIPEPGIVGHGLSNMVTRAEAVGGRLKIDMTPGRIVVELEMPGAATTREISHGA